MHILLVDDHALLVQGMQFLLCELDANVSSTVCTSLKQALDLSESFDLILLDYHLPDANGEAALLAMRSRHTGVPVVMLSGEESPQVILRLVEAGAAGFIPKNSALPVLIGALKLILAGGVYLPRTAYQNALTQNLEPTSPALTEGVELTERQREVLLKVVQGKINKVIAKEMDLSEGTIKAHLSSAFRVLGVANRAEAVYKVAQMRLKTNLTDA